MKMKISAVVIASALVGVPAQAGDLGAFTVVGALLGKAIASTVQDQSKEEQSVQLSPRSQKQANLRAKKAKMAREIDAEIARLDTERDAERKAAREKAENARKAAAQLKLKDRKKAANVTISALINGIDDEAEFNAFEETLKAFDQQRERETKHRADAATLEPLFPARSSASSAQTLSSSASLAAAQAPAPAPAAALPVPGHVEEAVNRIEGQTQATVTL